jgi:transcriptional regulator with XRE-family HTH domain
LKPKVSGIGAFIKQERLERGITQDRLCMGLCDVSTLSRIERGVMTPASFLRHALLERLGYYSNIERSVFWEESNIEFVERKKALTMATLHRDIPEMKRLISEYEQKKEFLSGIGLQALKTSMVILDMYEMDYNGKDFDFDANLKVLVDSIKITIPGFNEDKISEYLLTSEEIRCINAMSNVYLRKQDSDSALRILLALKDNLDRLYVNKYEISWYYPSILINIIWQYNELGNLDEAIALCEVGREFCIKYNEYSKIAPLLFLYGDCLVKSKKMEEAKFVLLNSYHVFCAFYKYDEAGHVAAFYSKVFDEDIDYVKPYKKT